jgi:parallel beta-helix repeat protein
MFSKLLAAALIGLGVSASAAQAQTVTSPANAGPGTLRSAINQANANANLSVITFSLPAAGTVITPAFDLPALTAPVEIDGYTQVGSAPAPASGTGAASPIVTIDAVNTTRALELNTDDSLIQGLTILDSSGVALTEGIQVAGDDNRIEGNHIGTSTTGVSKGFQNLTTGVAITGDDNIVGGEVVEDANVIAEGDGDGVAITGDHNTVVGNRLGLPYGTGGLGNAGNGVTVTGNTNQIGSQNTGGRNVISDNTGDGVAISGNNNRVEGNYVGLDETGANAGGNTGNGISFAGNQNLASGNVSSGNDAGVFVDGTSNTIMANALGTDAARTAEVGNDDGVHIAGGVSNVVGGDEEDERNLIAGNRDSGVEIEGGQNHRVEGNDIGSAALPNDDGVLVESSFNIVERNLVSGNRDAGVKVDGDPVGPPPILNVVDGNEISGNDVGVFVEDSHRNAITGNAISANVDEGVLIEALQLPNANENRLTGNTIKGNGLSGVRIEDADENLVGQPDEEINVITGNGEDGVTVESGDGNAVVNNSIYDNGNLGIDLDADGVTTNDGLLDPDSGANGLQNHPSISGHQLVIVQLGGLFIPKSRISWTLRSAAATDYRLEFYVNDTCGGRGEAKELVATRQVATDGTGMAQGSVDIAPVDEKVTVSATETDPGGLLLGPTSELSQCG